MIIARPYLIVDGVCCEVCVLLPSVKCNVMRRDRPMVKNNTVHCFHL